MRIVRLRPEEEAALADFAEATGRSEDELAHGALAEYVAAQRWHVEAVRQGIAEADARLLLSDEEVTAWAESLGSDRPLPLTGAKRAL